MEQATYWRREKLANDKLLAEAQEKLSSSEEKKQLEARASQFQAELARVKAAALQEGKSEGFSSGQEAGKEEGLQEGRERYLNSAEHAQFILDTRSQCRMEYLASEEHKKLIIETRLAGAKDFIKSPVFQTAVEIKDRIFWHKVLNDALLKLPSSKVLLKGSTLP
ncbi:UNVERIFIED_CONTAM: hypothetical protein Sradi_4340400 [Sesamum radiatum]|uniref:Uncharacterized protein n=1 Tax=Sesamum radiatum TaxID=300843 RepID=A0AAW2NP73_SESRA